MSTEQRPHGDAVPSRQLATVLRRQIDDGALAPGDKLPSERALATTHQVARGTAREAIKLLAQSGLVRSEHGRAWFVRAKPRLMRFGAERYSNALRRATGVSPYRIEVESQGRTPSVDCRRITHEPAPAEVSSRLGLTDATEVVRRENWYFADDEPMQVGVTYIPLAIAMGSPLADSADLGPGSLYARFEDAGHRIAAIREEITARMPSSDERVGLAIPDGVPVLNVWHTGIDDRGSPFEVTQFVMRADFNGLDYTIPVEG
ncbi:MAG: GntR family transcriptional regulator [Nocardioides sp.]